MSSNNQTEELAVEACNEEIHCRKQYFPIGFRFFPTDQEILKHYLPAKVKGVNSMSVQIIRDFDVYQSQPSDLPDLNKEELGHSYYYTLRDRKHPNGNRPNRNTKDGKGYWRMTSKLTEIKDSGGSSLGKKNTLVYFLKNKGEKGKGGKTNWIMHEYVLDESWRLVSDVVLCRIYERITGKAAEREREQSTSYCNESLQERFGTESAEEVDNQTNPLKRKQSTIEQTYEIGETRCKGQWDNTQHIYEQITCVRPLASISHQPMNVNPITVVPMDVPKIEGNKEQYDGFANASMVHQMPNQLSSPVDLLQNKPICDGAGCEQPKNNVFCDTSIDMSVQEKVKDEEITFDYVPYFNDDMSFLQNVLGW